MEHLGREQLKPMKYKHEKRSIARNWSTSGKYARFTLVVIEGHGAASSVLGGTARLLRQRPPQKHVIGNRVRWTEERGTSYCSNTRRRGWLA